MSSTIPEDKMNAYKSALELYWAGKYEESAPVIKEVAELGLADAQCYLGLMCYNGNGVAQSKTESIEWYLKATKQGHPRAQLLLGLMYDAGEGVEQSDKEAARWIRKSAEQGFADAQYCLGMAYNIGRIVPESKVEAMKWLRLAADQGQSDALEELEFFGDSFIC